MPVEQLLTPAQAASVLLSRTFSRPFFSEEMARRFHLLTTYTPFTEEGARFWQATFQDPQRSQLLVDTVTRTLDRSKTASSVLQLNDRELIILRTRHGLENGRIQTLKEIKQQVGLRSGERVRQIEARALRLLKQPSLAQDLLPLLPEK